MFWRWALQGLLQHALRETVSQAMAQETEEAASGTQSASRPTPPGESETAPESTLFSPCDLGLIFALEIEASGVLEQLEDRTVYRGNRFAIFQGIWAGHKTVVLIAGVGQAAAHHGIDALLKGHAPRYVISAGFAGALSPDIQKYDITVPEAIVNESGGSVQLTAGLTGSWENRPPYLHRGRLLTVDRLIRTTAEKLKLGQLHRAAIVDMETFAIAHECCLQEVPFVSVRVISDAVTEELPKDIETILLQKTSASRVGAALRTLVRRPMSIKDLWKLKEQALIASDKLAKFLTTMVSQWQPRDADSVGQSANSQP